MGPLAGLRILDLTRLLPGPFGTMLLADLGADVIKVEEPRRGDPARHYPPLHGDTGELFLQVNRNKRSLTLDLKAAAGPEVLSRLVEHADVLVESFRPGVMDRLGVGYDRLVQRNPRLVYASLSGFGQTGPYRDRAAHDLNYLALAGMLGYNVDAAGTPVLPAVPPADLGGGALAALAILAAVIGRGQTGRGQAVEVSLFGSAVALLPTLIAPLFSAGQPAPPGTPMLAGGLAQYAVYRTADGRFLSVGALEPHLWQNFLAAVDRLDLLPLTTGGAAEQATLRAELAALFASRTLRTWLTDLAGVDTCVAPVQTLPETLADPHVDAQRMVGSVTHPRLGPLRQLSPPFSLSDTPARIERPPPDLGADTDAVLAESHFTPAEIAALHATHTI